MIPAPSSMSLPPYKHTPQQNPRHDCPVLAHWTAAARHRTDNRIADDNPTWHYARLLLAHGYYWEAHDALEPLWHNAPPKSAERHFLQGLIQIANAALKLKMHRPKAALRLTDIARSHLNDIDNHDTIIGQSLAATHTLCDAIAALARTAPQDIQALDRLHEMHYSAKSLTK